MLEDQQTFWKQ